MTRLDDRITELESTVQSLIDRLARLDPVSDELGSEQTCRKCASVDLEDRVSRLETSLRELSGKVEALAVSPDQHQQQWPRVGSEAKTGKDGWTLVTRKRTESARSKTSTEEAGDRKVTVGEKIRSSEGNVVVMGDSLARGMGYKLREQVGDRVAVKAVGGSRLSEVSQAVGTLPIDKRRNLVVVAGANSLKDVMSEGMLRSYGEMIDNGKRVSNGIIVVGLVKRYDLGPSFERKRNDINSSLKSMCKVKGVEFVEYEPERSRVHGDGLHLNFRGQNELGRMVFGKLKSSFLG